MCLWAIYILPRWVCLFCWRKYVDWSWEYINRSKTHECGNWGLGHAIPRKRIYKRNCRCSVWGERGLYKNWAYITRHSHCLFCRILGHAVIGLAGFDPHALLKPWRNFRTIWPSSNPRKWSMPYIQLIMDGMCTDATAYTKKLYGVPTVWAYLLSLGVTRLAILTDDPPSVSKPSLSIFFVPYTFGFVVCFYCLMPGRFYFSQFLRRLKSKGTV